MKMFYQQRHSQRFSIRKFSFGAASVLLGTLACLHPSAVSADEVNEVDIEVSSVMFNENPVSISNSESFLSDAMDVTDSSDDSAVMREVLDTKSVSLEPAVKRTKSNIEAIIDEDVLSTTDSLPVPVSYTDVVVMDMSTAGDKNPYSDSPSHQDVLDKPSDLKPLALSTDAATKDSNDLLKSEPESAKMLKTGFAFRTANHSTAIGDNYPQIWKNGIVGVSADKWRLYVKECVSFVAFRLSTVNGFEMPPAYGNANLWGHRARQEGYRVDKTPGLGAVAWFDSNQHGAFGYGHVAWVSNIMGDQVELEEYNFGVPTHIYHRRVIHKNQVSGYIHFKDLVGDVAMSSSQPAASNPKISSQLAPSGSYTFTKQSGIKAEPKMSSADLAHYASGQSVNYDQVLEADGYQWISYLSYAGNRRYIPITPLKAETPKPSGKLTVENKNNQEGTMEVIISQVPQDANIRTVKLGVWSTLDGKDDIVWHTARKQSNGQYKVTVDIAQHDDYRGEYQMELQYVTQDRQKIKVASQKVHVGTNDKKVPEKAPLPIKTAPQHNLPPKGTYRFTQRSDIKAEPKMSSANLAYYNIGDTVNYDRIVQSEGKNWLSYLSFAGNRRYIALP